MASSCFRRTQRLASVLFALLVVLLAACPALAKSYEVKRVDIDATVAADGSLGVVERHTYSFDGSFNGVLWDIPRGTYEGRSVDTSVVSVAVLMDGKQVALAQAPSNPTPTTDFSGTYSLTEGDDCLHLRIFWPVRDQTVTYQVAYEMPNLATRWVDVGELYWQYVPADVGSGVEWHNVTATVHLPVPQDEQVLAGYNVRAWGHGPLDATVDITDDGALFFAPGVGAAEFLEARVVFPAAWLSQTRATDAVRLQAILDEEEQWVKDANAKRLHARLVVYGIPAFMALFGLVTMLINCIYKLYCKSRGPKPQFADKYYRDVPTNDHPAVLGMLYKGGKVKSEDFTATLMRLTDQGRIGVDAVWIESEGKRGKKERKREWRLFKRNAGGAKAADNPSVGSKKIDDAAFSFLFDVVGDKHKHVIDESLLGPSGEPYVLTSFFDETAKRWPKAYEDAYDKWSDAVRSVYDERKFVASDEHGLFPGVLALADFFLGVVLCIAGALAGSPEKLLIASFLLCFFVAGIYCIFVDDSTPTVVYSQEAVDIKAKMEALKRWLEDFTRLEEAIPGDVVLWNRLLGMATVLGVADKVIDQLRVHAPQVLASPAFSAGQWYASGAERDLAAPAALVARSVELGCRESSSQLSHEVSSSDTASSRDSSSSGSGGGFSGGGGGGFSGGGRGGAF